MSFDPSPDDEEATSKAVRIVVADDPTGTIVLRLVGEADSLAADELRSALRAVLRACPSSVAIDLADLAYCDLSGVEAIDDCLGLARDEGQKLEVRNASELVIALRELSRDNREAWLKGLAVSSFLTDHEE